MFHRRSVVKTILDGPNYVVVRRNKRDYKKISIFDLMLKIKKRSAVQESWAIYVDGDKIPGAVLRYAKLENKAMLEANSHNAMPQMSIVTRYVTQEFYEPFAKECEALDALILAGNLPHPAVEFKPGHIFTLFRIADDFSIELNWNGLSEAPALESSMLNLAARIEETLQQHKKQRPRKIERLEFVYRNPEPDAIEILVGEP
jgi:hypothetical protein